VLPNKYRPKKFSEVRGAAIPKKALQRIVKNPDGVPQSIILSGEWGCGKTSCSRIFARALNCERKTGDACNECPTCLSIVDGSPLYTELDSAIVGNVEYMRSIRDSFNFKVQRGYRVVEFDECQLINKTAQSALLKVLEEAPPGIFFLFGTTNSEALLDTIHSRSVELEFDRLSDTDILELLRDVAGKESITLSQKCSEYIARRVKGHARDSLMQLDLVHLIGEQSYMEQSVFLETLFKDLINAFSTQDTHSAAELVNRICSHPVLFIEQDFEIFIRKIADSVWLSGNAANKKLKDLVFWYLKYHRLLQTTNDWALFLTSIASLFEVTKAAPTLEGRFQR